jgi:uncharacterized protein DUF5825
MTMLTVSAWRDREPATFDIPGMRLGTTQVSDPVSAAATLVSRGARYVRLPAPVDLTGDDPAAATALVLVRELTSHGVAVDWEIELGHELQRWPMLSHLYPPRAIGSAGPDDDALATWRRTYHVAKLCYRHGPHFIQIRDYRTGNLTQHVIRIAGDSPDFGPAAISGAMFSVRTRYFFQREGLTLDIAGQTLWLPYRIRTWPLTHLMV